MGADSHKSKACTKIFWGCLFIGDIWTSTSRTARCLSMQRTLPYVGRSYSYDTNYDIASYNHNQDHRTTSTPHEARVTLSLCTYTNVSKVTNWSTRK